MSGGLLRVEVAEQAGDWSDIQAKRAVQALVPIVSRRCPWAEGIVTIALAEDDLVHDLNRRYRRVDRPTNVLSFPSGEATGPESELGDVVLAVETLRREAEAESRSLDQHFAHLALHGLLHILGYDHERDADAVTMETMETEILAELGIPDPYAGNPAAMID